MSENKSRTLTRAALLREEPCYTYSSRFIDRFPESGVAVTVELAVEQAEDWDWWWAANSLLTPEGYQQWREIQRAAEPVYEDSLRPYNDLVNRAYELAAKTRAKIMRGMDFYSKEWDAANDRASAAEQEILEIPRAASKAAYRVAGKHLHRAEAKAFAEIFISEGGNENSPILADAAPAEDEYPTHSYYCDECDETHYEYNG